MVLQKIALVSLDPEAYAVVNSGVEITTALLNKKKSFTLMVPRITPPRLRANS
jgi:hypothetical protein